MRVLIAGQTYYKKNNGQAVFTVHLAEGLAQAGHEVLALVPSESWRAYRTSQNGLILQTVPTIPLKYSLNVTGFSRRLIHRTVTEFQPDVVHIQDHYFLSRRVSQIARARGLVTVGTNHFLPENLTYNFRIPAWARAFIHRLLWSNMLAVYNTLDAVTTPTETAVRILRAQQIQAPVQAISCGVDVQRFHPRPELDRAELRRRYGLDPDKTLFLYVGRVDREKELDLVMRALARLDRDDVQLAIAGRGSALKDLQDLGQHLSLGQRLVFTGYVPNEDLPHLLNSADIFVMPSRAELQSIATLEAMASGLPVLAANARALPELVDHQRNGYLFEPSSVAAAAQGLASLADSRAQWAAMGAASLAKARAHRLENTIQAYVNFYRAAVASAQAKPEPVPARPAESAFQARYPLLSKPGPSQGKRVFREQTSR